jgi:hypothetical protein
MASKAKTVSSTEEVQIDPKKLVEMPVDKAIEYAFKYPPWIASIILGPPGIGKTEMAIEQAMQEAMKKGKTFVMLNEAKNKLSESEYRELIRDIIKNPSKYYVFTLISLGSATPDDLMGVPQIVSITDGDKVLAVHERTVRKAPLMLLTIKDIHGVLFIDDALNANDPVRQSFLLHVLNERVVGGVDGVKLSPNVRVIVTGNLTSDSEIAVPLPKPTAGRAWMPRVKPTSLEKWYQKMQSEYKDGWFKEVYAFLKRYENYYCRPDLIEEEPPVGPIPRSWTKLAVALKAIEDDVKAFLKEDDGALMLTQIVSGFVGLEAAQQFVTFLRKPVVSVEDVLKNPAKLDEIADDMDLVFRFAVQLGDKIKTSLSKGETDKLFKYLGVLVKLMDKTTNDIGVFVYEMLSSQEKRYLRKILKQSIASEDKTKREIAASLRSRVLLNVSISEALFGNRGD